MKKIILFIILLSIFSSCGTNNSTSFFGRGVKIATDPRTLGTQIDDSIMQKNLKARILLTDKKYLIQKIGVKVLDGRIFLTGKVDDPEEKLKITKMAWELNGARSVKNDIKIKEEFNFKISAKDALITSQLRVAMMFNNEIISSNYKIDTYKKKIYIYGIASTEEERRKVINEAKEVLDVEKVIASILLVEDLSRQKN
jgi:osmotically-inducible protein OsmY